MRDSNGLREIATANKEEAEEMRKRLEKDVANADRLDLDGFHRISVLRLAVASRLFAISQATGGSQDLLELLDLSCGQGDCRECAAIRATAGIVRLTASRSWGGELENLAGALRRSLGRSRFQLPTRELRAGVARAKKVIKIKPNEQTKIPTEKGSNIPEARSDGDR